MAGKRKIRKSETASESEESDKAKRIKIDGEKALKDVDSSSVDGENKVFLKLNVSEDDELVKIDENAVVAKEEEKESHLKSSEQSPSRAQIETARKEFCTVKDIYVKTNKLLHIEVCFRLEELIKSSIKQKNSQILILNRMGIFDSIFII
jgi:hypothetical protein